MAELILTLNRVEGHGGGERVHAVLEGAGVGPIVEKIDLDEKPKQQSLVEISGRLESIDRYICTPGQAYDGDLAGSSQALGYSVWRLFFAANNDGPNELGRRLWCEGHDIGVPLCVRVRAPDFFDRPGSAAPQPPFFAADIPWNFIRIRDGGNRLPMGSVLEFAVELPETCGKPPLTKVPARVRVFASSPTDRDGFNTLWCMNRLKDEWLERAGRYFEFPADFSVDMERPTSVRFKAGLKESDVVFFIGHGTSDDGTGSPGIYLTDPSDKFLKSQFYPATVMGAVLAEPDTRVRLLVLNCCHSTAIVRAAYAAARQASGGAKLPFPQVVAIPTRWPVHSAFQFHEALMRGLMQLSGQSLGETVSHARWDAWGKFPDAPVCSPHPHLPLLFVPGGPVVGNGVLDLEVDVREASPVGLNKKQRSVVRDAAEKRRGQRGVAGVVDLLKSGLLNAQPVGFRPFRIDKYPVTKRLWRQFCKAYGGSPAFRADWQRYGDASALKLDEPVCVSFEAAEFYAQAMGKRLPLWWEWEMAARWGREMIVPWGVKGREPASDLLADPWAVPGRPRCNVQDAGAAGPVSVFEFFTAAPEHPPISGADEYCADMIGNAPEFVLLDESAPGVAGHGWEGPLVANIPSYHRRLQPRDLCAFRCVRDV